MSIETAPAVVKVIPPRSAVPLKGQTFVDTGTKKRFGLWLRAARKAKGWSIAELAGMISVTPDYLARIEAGVRSIARRDDLLNRLAHVLDVDAREVFKQAQPTAPELDFDETVAGIESMAVRLTTAKGDNPKQRRYRTLGRALLDTLKEKGRAE